MNEKIYTIKEAAELLKLSYYTVRQRMMKLNLGTRLHSHGIYLNADEIKQIDECKDNRYKYR